VKILLYNEPLPKNWAVWPCGFVSKDDGCFHFMVTDFNILGQKDSFEAVWIPRHEIAYMWE